MLANAGMRLPCPQCRQSPHCAVKFYISHVSSGVVAFLKKVTLKWTSSVNLEFDMKPAGVFVSLDSESPWPGGGVGGAGGWDPGPLCCPDE